MTKIFNKDTGFYFESLGGVRKNLSIEYSPAPGIAKENRLAIPTCNGNIPNHGCFMHRSINAFIHLNGSPYGGLDAVNPDPLNQTLKLISSTSK